MEKPSGAASPLSPSPVDNHYFSKRDRWEKHYRVVYVQDKYYNKWFMSKVPSKKWNKESNFKLKYRMLEINAVQEYEDVDQHEKFYKKGSVSRIVTDGEVMNVI